MLAAAWNKLSEELRVIGQQSLSLKSATRRIGHMG
jgi:hypothetical protein